MTPRERAENIVRASRQDRYQTAVAFGEFVRSQIEEAIQDIKADRERWADSACRLETKLEKYKDWLSPSEFDIEVKRAIAEAFSQKEHYQRLLAWSELAAKSHPQYGPCDALDSGRCTACIQTAVLAERERCAKIAEKPNCVCYWCNHNEEGK